MRTGDSFELVALKSGAKTLRSTDHGETFHPGIGPVSEARAIHVGPILRAAPWEDGKCTLWDVGLGGAANAIAAIDALAGRVQVLVLHSFDRSLDALGFALRHREELGYLSGWESTLGRLVAAGLVEFAHRGARVRWHLHCGDFTELVKTTDADAPSAVMFDPYSPGTNPAMWTLNVFESLRTRTRARSLLTSYTRSTGMRVAMSLSGFFVGAGRPTGEKEQTTVAATCAALLEAPLDRRWLERVRASTNSAPLRDASYSQRRIAADDLARLEQLPQFQIGRDAEGAR